MQRNLHSAGGRTRVKTVFDRPQRGQAVLHCFVPKRFFTSIYRQPAVLLYNKKAIERRLVQYYRILQSRWAFSVILLPS